MAEAAAKRAPGTSTAADEKEVTRVLRYVFMAVSAQPSRLLIDCSHAFGMMQLHIMRAATTQCCAVSSGCLRLGPYRSGLQSAATAMCDCNCVFWVHGASRKPGIMSVRVFRCVLRARDDYEVLRLSPGCTLTALKKRYRELAVVLHPDKSTVSSFCLLQSSTVSSLQFPNS